MIIKNYVIMAAIAAVLMTGLVSSSPYALGVPPEGGFLGSQNCKFGPTAHQQFPATCCWKASNGDEICQTCTFVYTDPQTGQGSYTDCQDAQIQMPPELSPDNPPSSPTGPSAPIQDNGVLEQTDNPNKGSVMNLPNSGERTLE